MDNKQFIFLGYLVLIVGAAVFIADEAFNSATITTAAAIGTGAFVLFIERSLARNATPATK
jgi:uncharacterized membrane-anchored protein